MLAAVISVQAQTRLPGQDSVSYITHDFCVLETVSGRGTELVEGIEAIRYRRYPPASLFKILVAWAAFERGLADAATPFLCQDAPGGPRELTLAQAMFVSSNDYFRTLSEAVGKAELDARAIQAGWLAEGATDRWLAKGASGIERGGEMRVTPAEVHAFTVMLMEGKVGSNARVRAELLRALRRPPDGQGPEVFAKTGAWGGAAWMTGFGPDGKKGRKAVTVLVSYRVPNWRPARDLAVRTFYDRLNLEPEAEIDRRVR